MSKQQMDYEESLKIYRDLNNVTDTAFGKGRKEGREEERLAIASNMKRMGLPITVIMQATGLTEDELQKL